MLFADVFCVFDKARGMLHFLNFFLKLKFSELHTKGYLRSLKILVVKEVCDAQNLIVCLPHHSITIINSVTRCLAFEIYDIECIH